jgi:hypothetical protein
VSIADNYTDVTHTPKRGHFKKVYAKGLTILKYWYNSDGEFGLSLATSYVRLLLEMLSYSKIDNQQLDNKQK